MGRRGKALLILIAAGYAGLALANGIDRMSLRGEVSGRLVPQMLRAQLYRQDARLELRGGNADAALAAAARAVQREPVEPGSSSILGSVKFARGDNAGAYAAFRVAGTMGWRDTATQAYLLLAALAFDDRQRAAERLDAIMRVDPDLPQSQPAIVNIEADSRGQAALLARLAEGPGWLTRYAAAAAKLAPPAFANRMTLLERAAAQGRVAVCPGISDAVNTLAYEQQRFAEARRLWLAGCGKPQDRAAIADSGFDRTPPPTASPFDWNLPGAGGVSASIEQGQLIARNDNIVKQDVAHQYLLLPTGAVDLAWQGSAERDEMALVDAVQLRCPDGSRAIAADGDAVRTGTGQFTQRFAILAGCSPQKVVVRLDRAAGEVRLDRLSATVAPPGTP